MATKFKAPAVEPGQSVIWYDGGNKTSAGLSYAAFVTRVNTEAGMVDLLVLAPAALGGMLRYAVRHISDPDRLKSLEQLSEAGAWDHTQLHYDYLKTKEDLAQLWEYVTKKDQKKAS